MTRLDVLFLPLTLFFFAIFAPPAFGQNPPPGGLGGGYVAPAGSYGTLAPADNSILTKAGFHTGGGASANGTISNNDITTSIRGRLRIRLFKRVNGQWPPVSTNSDVKLIGPAIATVPLTPTTAAFAASTVLALNQLSDGIWGADYFLEHQDDQANQFNGPWVGIPIPLNTITSTEFVLHN